MDLNYNCWKRLFLFGLGLSIGTAFCMKWMENDLQVNGEKFTMLGLELFYSKEKVSSIFTSLDERVKTILQYHLSFDFVFMAGIFPGIASLCMMARKKQVSLLLNRFLYIVALFQLLAWAGDIIENIWLLRWIQKPVIGDEFIFFHLIVAGKWIIALIGVLLGVVTSLRFKK